MLNSIVDWFNEGSRAAYIAKRVALTWVVIYAMLSYIHVDMLWFVTILEPYGREINGVIYYDKSPMSRVGALFMYGLGTFVSWGLSAMVYTDKQRQKH